MSRHVNIPVFIPHLGCPNQCVFCNQRSITGVSEFDPKSVKPVIDTALETVEPDADVEIAFFGGSFTGIDYDLMCELLSIAHTYVSSGRVQSIRCSTRPDYINESILETLKRYGVKTIELGLQSASDEVLEMVQASIQDILLLMATSLLKIKLLQKKKKLSPIQKLLLQRLKLTLKMAPTVQMLQAHILVLIGYLPWVQTNLLLSIKTIT